MNHNPNACSVRGCQLPELPAPPAVRYVAIGHGKAVHLGTVTMGQLGAVCDRSGFAAVGRGNHRALRELDTATAVTCRSCIRIGGAA